MIKTKSCAKHWNHNWESLLFIIILDGGICSDLSRFCVLCRRVKQLRMQNNRNESLMMPIKIIAHKEVWSAALQKYGLFSDRHLPVVFYIVYHYMITLHGNFIMRTGQKSNWQLFSNRGHHIFKWFCHCLWTSGNLWHDYRLFVAEKKNVHICDYGD